MPRRPTSHAQTATLDREVDFSASAPDPNTVHVIPSHAGYYVWNPVHRVVSGAPHATRRLANEAARTLKMRLALDGYMVGAPVAPKPAPMVARRVDARQRSIFDAKENRGARYYVVDEPRVDSARPFAVYDAEGHGTYPIGRYATRAMANTVAHAESAAGPRGEAPAPPYFMFKSNPTKRRRAKARPRARRSR